MRFDHEASFRGQSDENPEKQVLLLAKDLITVMLETESKTIFEVLAMHNDKLENKNVANFYNSSKLFQSLKSEFIKEKSEIDLAVKNINNILETGMLGELNGFAFCGIERLIFICEYNAVLEFLVELQKSGFEIQIVTVYPNEMIELVKSQRVPGLN